MQFIYPPTFTPSATKITFAQPDFGPSGIPHSEVFGDVYFSDAGGASEKEQVFVKGNGLPKRLMESPLPEFAVGETGFGSGLSLLMLIKNLKEAGFWEPPAPENISSSPKATAPISVHPKELIYLSTELYPMTRADMRKAHQVFPEITAESQELLNAYAETKLHLGLNVLTPWPHTKIYLLVGDVLETLPQLEIRNGGIDAWFLDGFSPQKDLAMWSPECAQQLQRLSRRGATIATYTVSGFVRRNLIAAGFAVQKIPGFGRKKEMLAGVLTELSKKSPTSIGGGGCHTLLTIKD